MKTSRTLLTSAILLISSTAAYAQKVTKTDSAQSSSFIPGRYQGLTHRDPLVALSLSFIPSAGFFYNRQYLAGGLILGADAASIIVIATDKGGNSFGPDGPVALSIVLLTSTYIYSIIDAPISSVHLNHKYHLTNTPNTAFSTIHFSPTVINSVPDHAFNRPLPGFMLTLN